MADTDGVTAWTAVEIDLIVRHKSMMALIAVKNAAFVDPAVMVLVAQVFSPRQKAQQSEPQEQIKE